MRKFVSTEHEKLKNKGVHHRVLIKREIVEKKIIGISPCYK